MADIAFIDTHAHLDDEAFADDLPQVMARAKAAGVCCVFLPAIDVKTTAGVLNVCRQYPDYAFPMVGLHPEEVKDDFPAALDELYAMLKNPDNGFIAVGEVGLDYYWSREYESQQLQAFERQVEWSIETRLPLMIHCRKAQHEMVKLLQSYEAELPGGVFHCFTGNEHEATELLRFSRFSLGIGGVLTFKKSKLPEVLPDIPLERIVLETDSPYMAPVPMRGQRNESAYVKFVLEKMAECYGMDVADVARTTTENVKRIFGVPGDER